MIDVERFESMKKELQFNRFELKETRERAMNFSARLNELENQHLKTVCLLILLIMIYCFLSIVDSGIE